MRSHLHMTLSRLVEHYTIEQIMDELARVVAERVEAMEPDGAPPQQRKSISAWRHTAVALSQCAHSLRGYFT